MWDEYSQGLFKCYVILTSQVELRRFKDLCMKYAVLHFVNFRRYNTLDAIRTLFWFVSRRSVMANVWMSCDERLTQLDTT
jgi:hypothetical protein